ncbi:hypothetical protein [Runella zeae]|uniref:hypothetical protein n=1 Tax=Runella zeae TaxID=94255 RepID=UPI000416DF2E|nr:hypothetical protein [Runella zeae]
MKKEKAVAKSKKSLDERFQDDFDAIYRHYTNPNSKLSEKQQEQLQRWTWCREWYITYEPFTNRELVNVMMQQFEISEKQAYIDVYNTMKFFASMEKVNKEAEKVMMVHRLKKRRHKLDAIVDTEPKAAGEATKADKLLAEVLGFMEPDNLIPAPVIIEINPVFDPTLLGFEPIQNLELKLKKYRERKKNESQAIDVTYDELMENPNAIPILPQRTESTLQ